MLKEKLPAIGRALSLLLLVATIAVIVSAFIRARRRPVPPGPIKAEAKLKANVTSRVEGYERVMLDEHGHEKYRLRAAVDTAYDDGRHEMEKVDLTALGETEKDGKQKSVRITSERGAYTPDQNLVTFETNVIVTSSDGLEVKTERLNYDQKAEVASTDIAVQFKQGEISGSSVGAQLYAKEHLLNLLKDSHIVATPSDPKKKNGQPVTMQSEKASYAETQGIARFEGNATVTQGEKLAHADLITGFVNVQTKKLERVEMRGNSQMKSHEKTKTSELQSRDMDFYFDEVQHLKQATATGSARATSLEKDSPREISAEKIDAYYTPGEKESLLQSVVTQGRTAMKIEAVEAVPNAKEVSAKEVSAREVSERLIEADAVNATFREDGVSLARAEATGNAVLTITPKTVKAKSDRQRLNAAKFTADFFSKGNAIKTFLADGNAVAEFEPLEQKTKRSKRTVTGKKLTANLQEQTQDIDDLTVEGGAKFVERFPEGAKVSERNATADRAVYTASNQIVALRGKPLLWDSSSRANADEIDANVETSESFLRGKVRTTYFSREKTGGAAPFKKDKAPVTIASDRAVVKHNEGAARYTGNVRAWQDNDFIRSDNMELDNGERTLTAWGNAQSAFYDFEREVEKNRKEVIPVFATADKLVYTDANRTAHYEGNVKVKQGTDQIDAAVADAVMDEQHKLVQLTASNNVVMTQPQRRAIGDQVVYTAANDTAILTALAGKLAMIEDREREAVTKSEKLTLHLRDARIEAGSENGSKKRVKTTHRIQN